MPSDFVVLPLPVSRRGREILRAWVTPDATLRTVFDVPGFEDASAGEPEAAFGLLLADLARDFATALRSKGFDASAEGIMLAFLAELARGRISGGLAS